MSAAIICTAPDSFEIDALIPRIRRATAASADISLLVADRPGSAASVLASRLANRSSVSIARRAGGIAGGVVGLLAGAGLLAIPGMGLYLAAGPIVAALSGAALGAAVGGISGVLIGMGLSESEALVYERKVRDGAVLLTVQDHGDSNLDRVRRILERARVDDVVVVNRSRPGTGR